jgi:hypothetical protein
MTMLRRIPAHRRRRPVLRWVLRIMGEAAVMAVKVVGVVIVVIIACLSVLSHFVPKS